MRLLNAANVAEFEPREGAALGIAERELDIVPPAEPGAGIQRGEQAIGGREAAADGPADPVVRLVEIAGALDNVKHRRLDAGTRGSEDWVPGLRERPRSVDNDSWDPPVPFGIAAMRNGELDQPTGAIRKAVQFRRGLVTEHGVWSGAEQGAPEFGPPGGLAGESGVNSTVHYLPAPETHLITDRRGGHARVDGLPDSKNPILPVDQS